MFRKIALGLLSCVGVFVSVIALKTWAYGPPSLPSLPAAAAVAVDKDAVARRLAQAIRIRTISHGFGAKVEANAFLELHAQMARSFPKVHATLKREIVGGYSLLYTWKGTNAKLKPILLIAHMDVVPVAPGTRAAWTHPPFGGLVAEGFIWGRGTMDDKGSVLAILVVTDVPPDRNLAGSRAPNLLGIDAGHLFFRSFRIASPVYSDRDTEGIRHCWGKRYLDSKR